MGEGTKIEWAHHTMNFWYGCTALSPACDHCYAETLVTKRLGKDFAERHRTGASNWKLPFLWDRRAAAAGERYRVFTLSLGDFWDKLAPIEWLVDALDVIRCTPNLDWLILTKRPQMILGALQAALREVNIKQRGEDFFLWLKGWLGGLPPRNVWLGVTAENQEQLELRAWVLSRVPAVLRFISYEPALGPLRLRRATNRWDTTWDVLTGRILDGRGAMPAATGAFHWVIGGGETGSGARAWHQDWARLVRDDCAAAAVPFLWKQNGDWAPEGPMAKQAWAIANDGSMWRMTDIAYPDGPRYGEAVRHGVDKMRMHTVYRVGKRASGRLLDDVEHLAFPASPALAA